MNLWLHHFVETSERSMFFFPRTQIPLGLCEEWNLIFKNERKRKYLLNKTYNLWISWKRKDYLASTGPWCAPEVINCPKQVILALVTSPCLSLIPYVPTLYLASSNRTLCLWALPSYLASTGSKKGLWTSKKHNFLLLIGNENVKILWHMFKLESRNMWVDSINIHKDYSRTSLFCKY